MSVRARARAREYGIYRAVDGRRAESRAQTTITNNNKRARVSRASVGPARAQTRRDPCRTVTGGMEGDWGAIDDDLVIVDRRRRHNARSISSDTPNVTPVTAPATVVSAAVRFNDVACPADVVRQRHNSRGSPLP